MFKFNEENFEEFKETEGLFTRAFTIEGVDGLVFLAKCDDGIVIHLVDGMLWDCTSLPTEEKDVSFSSVKNIAEEHLIN